MARSIEAVWLTEPVHDHDHWQGSWNAEVTLVEYGDFECPACGQLEPVIRRLQEQMGDRLLRIFRHAPNAQKHAHAAQAAEAAEAAAASGMFWDMHAMLFAHQDRLTDADLRGYADKLELDTRCFAHALSEHSHAERIEAQRASGLASGLDGTPCLFINGRRYDGPQTYAALLAAIEAARG